MTPYISSPDYQFREESDAGRLTRLPVETRDIGEWATFEKVYLPPASVPKDALIVDVGAEEGDSSVFFFEHGYQNLRVIEAYTEYFPRLEHNVAILRSLGANVDLRLERFRKEFLDGAGFVKFDCEGCEWDDDFGLAECGIPWGGELHMKGGPRDANGRYNYYISLGHFRGDGQKHIRQLSSDVMTPINWTYYQE
jgi:hypothetical protein